MTAIVGYVPRLPEGFGAKHLRHEIKIGSLVDGKADLIGHDVRRDRILVIGETTL